MYSDCFEIRRRRCAFFVSPAETVVVKQLLQHFVLIQKFQRFNPAKHCTRLCQQTNIRVRWVLLV